MSHHGRSISLDDAFQMLSEADADKDGRVNYNDAKAVEGSPTAPRADTFGFRAAKRRRNHRCAPS
ncbi:hypothetical protein Tcan_05863 [Toxocara canis]|uniref:EF-hand domain-containing protein n=1 Tax=Toxocara canis TaxID=6265 RepID=A0A0B2V2K2_TOXCA|nr:hypothetical protein Tcan_05863 [Toxocara canis]